MKSWSDPKIMICNMKMDENIAASGDSGNYLRGRFWYTGQGDGNRKQGWFYYIMDGNKMIVQDTVKAGGDRNIQKHDVDTALATCRA